MTFTRSFRTLALVFALACAGCHSQEVLRRGGRDIAEAHEAATVVLANLGQEVPDFNLPSLTGARVRLSDYRGKFVVLEWFNPLCPFTRHSHLNGTLKSYPEEARAAGVVWLAINSAADSKMGGALHDNRQAIQDMNLQFPLLLDPSGEVGRQFDATTSPQIFLIDKRGVLVYVGPPDNAPFGKVRGGGEQQNYIEQALTELRAGKPVSRPARSPYGCRVKYAQPTLGS